MSAEVVLIIVGVWIAASTAFGLLVARMISVGQALDLRPGYGTANREPSSPRGNAAA